MFIFCHGPLKQQFKSFVHYEYEYLMSSLLWAYSIKNIFELGKHLFNKKCLYFEFINLDCSGLADRPGLDLIFSVDGLLQHLNCNDI